MTHYRHHICCTCVPFLRLSHTCQRRRVVIALVPTPLRLLVRPKGRSNTIHCRTITVVTLPLQENANANSPQVSSSAPRQNQTIFHRYKLVVRLVSDPRAEVRRLSEAAVELSNLGKLDGGRQLRPSHQKIWSKVWPLSPRALTACPKAVCFVRSTRDNVHPSKEPNQRTMRKAVNHSKPKHKTT